MLFVPPPRWGGMVVATSKKTKDRKQEERVGDFFLVMMGFWQSAPFYWPGNLLKRKAKHMSLCNKFGLMYLC